MRQGDEALGRSRGGCSTKVHSSVDALGNPRRIILTRGQAHDIGTAPDLIEGEHTKAVVADKAYDSDEFLALIGQMGAIAVIPPRVSRTEQRDYAAAARMKIYMLIATRLNGFITRLSNTDD